MKYESFLVSYLLSPDYLEHYGVKGQKWGVRRYQNYDGTLTNLGKSRRGMNDINDIVSTMSKQDKNY